jgi:two-component system LytT family sensor kinase
MKNVRERLEVLYGADALFEVESRPGRGTRVTMGLPLLIGESNQHMTAVPLHHQ